MSEDTPKRSTIRDTGEPMLSRREFIRNTVRLAVAGAIIPGALSQLLPAVAPDALGGVGPGPVVRRDPTTNAKIPITLGDLEGEAPVVVTAEWNFLPAVIYKVRRGTLEGSSGPAGTGCRGSKIRANRSGRTQLVAVPLVPQMSARLGRPSLNWLARVSRSRARRCL